MLFVTMKQTLRLPCYQILVALLLSIGSSNAFLFQPSASVKSNLLRSPDDPHQVMRAVERTPTALQGKLWDRLEIEEDPEPMWYLLNCIATQELDLLRLCRARCGHMEDVVKFVVPVGKATRSHGPNRIVTDTKPRYQGYVFGKLRLCPEVYEGVQDLDLCRSWMGTVHRKGYRKLPPSPVALSEMEIEKFGLEDLEEYMEFDEDPAGDLMDENGIILDTEENEAKAEAKAKSKKPKIDQGQLDAYMELRPDDMVKVTGSNKFKGEDGIVKRLKNGQVMVRFFTYGSTYEEWLEPGDVRKLTHDEVLVGLSGPTAPVTQQDFEEDDDRQDNRPGRSGPGGGLRNALMSNVSGARGPRNTRQESTERGDRFKRDVFGRTDDERKKEENNWSTYQEQQRARDAGNRRGDKDNAMGDVDSQWGRYSQRQERRDRVPGDDRRRGPGDDKRPGQGDDNRRAPRNDRDNQRVEKAIDGGGDWSAFVTPSPKKSNQDDDAFFSSLMSELNGGQETAQKSASSANNDDDFFSSLMSELNDGEEKTNQSQKKRQTKEPVSNPDDNDFFAALEAELGDPSPSEVAPKSDDFMAKLEAEMSDSSPRGGSKKELADDGGDDFFAKLEKEMSEPGFVGATGSSEPVSSTSGNDNDFFAQLEAEIAAPKEESITRETTNDNSEKEPASRPKPSKAPPSSGLDGDSLGKSTVPKLKEMLKERGLKVSGKKSDLIERLLA
jgi:transcription antitermination factor NusG